MINRFKNPGVYLALMWWWVVAIFVIHLIVHPLPIYISSYIRYFGAFIVIGASAITIGFLNAKTNFWSRFGQWKRFFVLIGAYTLSVFLVLGSSVGMINYMFADFWGSSSRDSDFEMACLPTAIFYFIIGILWSVIFSIINLIKKKRTR